MSVQIEAEAAQLTGQDRIDMLEALGLGEGALPRLVRSAYHLLGLRTFFTTGDKESRAWTFHAGSKAPECAGKIHTDLQRGFIRADVIAWDELLAIGSWTKAKDLGKIRVEGKDYEVVDGDTLTGDLDFIVLGVQPPMPSPLPGDATEAQTLAYTEGRAARELYDNLFRTAADAEIPVLNWTRFETLTGTVNR